MKTSYFTAVLGLTCLLGFGGNAFAARDNARSVEILDAAQIGTTELKPSNYKVEWQGTRPCGRSEFPAKWEDRGHGARNVEDE